MIVSRSNHLLAIFILSAIGVLPTPLEAARRKRAKSVIGQVRSIQIISRNVFDLTNPSEDHWPFKAANFLHITTRESVIRHELLITPGQQITKNLMDESERKLRALPFIKFASIQAVPINAKEVDLIVETQDSWTIQPQINFGTVGGESSLGIGIEELNTLGYGKFLSAFYRKDSNGNGFDYAYGDRQLFGTRLQFASSFSQRSDSKQALFKLEHPFFSLDTPWAGGIQWNQDERLETKKLKGIQTNEYDEERKYASIFIGRKLNQDTDFLHRLSLKYSWKLSRFHPVPQTDLTTLPKEEVTVGPSLLWTYVESDFLKKTQIEKVNRVEDINFGHELSVEAGYSPRSLGATRTKSPLSATHSFGYELERPIFFLTTYGLKAAYTPHQPNQRSGHLSDELYFIDTTAYSQTKKLFPITGIYHFESAYLHHPSADRTLELGGDTGLRGYKREALTGNKSLLLNLEGRSFFPNEFLKLFYLGGALFFDAGQVREPGSGFTTHDTYANVGAGLRISLSRSSQGSVYRFDVAYALRSIENDKRIVVSISSAPAFRRNGNSFQKIKDFQTSEENKTNLP